MSQNHYKFECLSQTPDELAPLLAELQKVEHSIGVEGSALLPFLGGWDQPCVRSPALYGNLLVFVVIASSLDTISEQQIQALHAMGPEFIRFYADYTQAGDSQALCYHLGKKIATKTFPKPDLDQAGKAYFYVQQQQDAPLAALVEGGLDPNTCFNGRPLIILACENYLDKTAEALLHVGVDLHASKNYPLELAYSISSLYNMSTRHALLKGLIASGADLDQVWIAARGFYKEPAMTALLIAAGVNINQPLSDEEGSLLYELLDDLPELIALLEQHGGKALPPENQSGSDRLAHLIHGGRGADTIEQLLADGVDPNETVEGDPAALVALNDMPHVALSLLLAGADFSDWLEPIFFQKNVLYPLSFYQSEQSISEQDAAATLGIFKLLLAHGLDPDMHCQTSLYYQSSSSFHYEGPLFLMLMTACCADGNKWAPLRLPLATLFIEHGVDLNATGGRGSSLVQQAMLRANLPPEAVEKFVSTGAASVLHHLERQDDSSPEMQELTTLLKHHGAESLWVKTAPV